MNYIKLGSLIVILFKILKKYYGVCDVYLFEVEMNGLLEKLFLGKRGEK